MSILFESDRLLFREFDQSDAQNFYDLNNDPEVMKYTGDLAFKNISESIDLINNYNAYKLTGFGRWTVIHKSSGEILGWSGLKKLGDQTVDLGYRFHRKYWNAGYGTEAAKASLSFGFSNLGLQEIIGRTAIENVGSIRVLEKIGMSFWKKAPCEGIENSVFYKITRNEFEQI